MSQLPWGGKPTSPVDDPDNTTGPGQDAPAGPDPNAEKCDCTCPDYNELPWLPPGDGPPGGDPEYTGTYYRLIRCRDDAEQPAWVQTDEFATGDVLLIETDGVKTCFYVDSEEVANDQVQDTNVIRPADVEADFDTCAACRTSGPPAIVDPDPPLPPILPTSYAQLAFCSDDTLAPLWTPVEVFGVPVAEDLTKIYKIEGTCYYISNNIQPTPGGPLMPVFNAEVHPDCNNCQCIETSTENCNNFSDGKPPAYLDLTFAGVVACSCFSIGGFYYSVTFSENINKTFNLSIGGVNCRWGGDSIGVTLTRWTNSNCTTIDTTFSYTAAVTLNYLSGTNEWLVIIATPKTLLGLPLYGLVFRATATAISDGVGGYLGKSFPALSAEFDVAGDCGTQTQYLPFDSGLNTYVIGFDGEVSITCGAAP